MGFIGFIGFRAWGLGFRVYRVSTVWGFRA